MVLIFFECGLKAWVDNFAGCILIFFFGPDVSSPFF